MTPPDVAFLVLRAQCGDREALERLLLDVQPALRRYLVVCSYMTVLTRRVAGAIHSRRQSRGGLTACPDG